MCRFVGTVPDIVGLVWPSFRPKSGSKSQISGRILKSFRGPFSSAEQRIERGGWAAHPRGYPREKQCAACSAAMSGRVAGQVVDPTGFTVGALIQKRLRPGQGP